MQSSQQRQWKRATVSCAQSQTLPQAPLQRHTPTALSNGSHKDAQWPIAHAACCVPPIPTTVGSEITWSTPRNPETDYSKGRCRPQSICGLWPHGPNNPPPR
eukprot:7389236-Alexandrium_andersonii.AAC.1